MRPPADLHWLIADPATIRLDAIASAVAAGDISVLVLGETGCGKEIVSEVIHRRSRRRDGPFVAVNCAALSEGLLESELFGHERGAFTGAVRARPGLLESADGGTVLLDEIGEMSASLQAKLLRALETRQVTRVGATRARTIDVRVISATNRDLAEAVGQGQFRADLYYRLAAAVLRIPPLRDRPAEIEPLARLFLQRSARAAERPPPRLSPAALELLRRYAWPGNVRELRNAVEWALLLCRGDELRVEHLPDAITGPAAPPAGAPRLMVVGDGQAAPAAVGDQAPDESARIRQALDRCAGNQTRAARLLGISRGTLVARLTEFNLPRPRKRQQR